MRQKFPKQTTHPTAQNVGISQLGLERERNIAVAGFAS